MRSFLTMLSTAVGAIAANGPVAVRQAKKAIDSERRPPRYKGR